MRIVVLIKTVKYVYAQTGPDRKQNNIGSDDIIHMINPLDELALEEALRIKDVVDGTQVVALCLGSRFAEDALKRCLAMGADKGIHIFYEDYDQLDSWATATVLAECVRQLRCRMILCGREAIDDHNGLVGPYVAEMLGMTHLSSVVKIEILQAQRRLLVQRLVEKRNRVVMECNLPAVLDVEKGINTPRYPTLPGFLKAEATAIEKVLPPDLGFSSVSLSFDLNIVDTAGISRPKPKPKARAETSAKLSAAERIKLMMKGGRGKEKGDSNIIHGVSDDILAKIEQVFKECGVEFQKEPWLP